MSGIITLSSLVYLARPGQTGREILMMHRNKRSSDMHLGKWNGLGGKLVSGESPEQCARREVEEESGLRVDLMELRGVAHFPGFGEEREWYVFIFYGCGVTGSQAENAEGSLSWIGEDQLLTLPLWPADYLFVPWVLSGRFFNATFTYRQGELTASEVSFLSGRQL